MFLKLRNMNLAKMVESELWLLGWMAWFLW